MTDAKFVDNSAELAEALKQQAAHNERVEALLKLTREQDLAAAKRVIKQHNFTAKDLAPELRTTRRTARTTAPRKTASRRKTK